MVQGGVKALALEVCDEGPRFPHFDRRDRKDPSSQSGDPCRGWSENRSPRHSQTSSRGGSEGRQGLRPLPPTGARPKRADEGPGVYLLSRPARPENGNSTRGTPSLLGG